MLSGTYLANSVIKIKYELSWIKYEILQLIDSQIF